jgi:hypothetical protein
MNLESTIKKLERARQKRGDQLLIVYADADGGFVRYNGEDVPLYYDKELSRPFNPRNFRGREIWGFVGISCEQETSDILNTSYKGERIYSALVDSIKARYPSHISWETFSLKSAR